MCDFLDGIEEKGIEKGIEKGLAEGIEIGRAEGIEIGRAEGIELSRLETIKTIMETLSLTAQQAMDALRIPVEEQPKFLAKL